MGRCTLALEEPRAWRINVPEQIEPTSCREGASENLAR